MSQFQIDIEGTRVFFSAEDDYSKNWFFPRYEGGKMHEKPVTETLLKVLRDGDCFVDVGANLGWYTCIASKRLPKGTVHAFEMDGLNYSLLQKNVRLNNCRNVKTHQVAVADTTGIAWYRRESLGPSRDHRLAARSDDTGAGNLVRVETVALDDFFAGWGLMPDVVKIDVEGAEASVLKGMRRVLDGRRPALFVEVHPATLSLYESSAEEIVSLLMESGYSVFEIEGLREGGAEPSLIRLDPASKISQNIMLHALIE